MVPLVPVDEETGFHEGTWTDSGKCCKKAVLGALAVAVLGLFGLCVGHVAYAKPIALNELAQPSVRVTWELRASSRTLELSAMTSWKTTGRF